MRPAETMVVVEAAADRRGDDTVALAGLAGAVWRVDATSIARTARIPFDAIERASLASQPEGVGASSSLDEVRNPNLYRSRVPRPSRSGGAAPVAPDSIDVPGRTSTLPCAPASIAR